MKTKASVWFILIALTIALALAVVSIFCILNRGLSIYSFMGISSYRWAPTWTLFRLPKGGEILYIDSNAPQNIASVTTDYVSFSYALLWENTDKPPMVFCKGTITNVRNVVRKEKMSDRYSFTLCHSIVCVRVEDIIFDPTDSMQIGQEVLVYSFNSEFSKDGFPVLYEDKEYYLTLEPTKYLYPPVRDDYDEMSAFLRETVDYVVSELHFAKWPVIDGTVYVPDAIIASYDWDAPYTLLGRQWFYEYEESLFIESINDRFSSIKDLWNDVELQYWRPHMYD